MEQLIGASIFLLPIVVFGVALVLRISSEIQPEASWSGQLRKQLFVSSYATLGIGLLILLATALLGRPIAMIVFVLFLAAATQLIDIELRMAATRRRGQEVELLWMLATSIRSGRNLADDVEAYARGSWGDRHKRLLELAVRMRQGLPHSELAVPQGLLSRAATLEIQAGLQAGKLAEALRHAAVKRTQQLTDATDTVDAHAAITYPLAVMSVMVLMVGFVMYYIIPKFKKIFDDFGTELPRLTVLLIHISDMVVNYWYLGLPLLYPAFVAAGVISKAHFDGWPVLWQKWGGWWHVRPHTSDILRSLASTVAMGVPLERGLDPFVSSSGPVLLQRRAAAIRYGLAQGDSCWGLLEREGFLITREVVLIEAAQRAGNLPWALELLAESLDRRWLFRLAAAMELLRPVAILALGVVVAFVVIGLFMPLVKLLNDLS